MADTVTEAIRAGWRREAQKLMEKKENPERVGRLKETLQRSCLHQKHHVFQTCYPQEKTAMIVRICADCCLEEAHLDISEFTVLKEKSMDLAWSTIRHIRLFDLKVLESLDPKLV